MAPIGIVSMSRRPEDPRLASEFQFPAVVVSLWLGLGIAAAARGPLLDQVWPDWQFGFGASAIWGLNLLVLRYGVGPPIRLTRPPILAATFAFAMTLFGSGSYWATVQLYPAYHVAIERAAWFVAVCTLLMLLSVAIVQRVLRVRRLGRQELLEWDWPRLGATTYMLFVIALFGTIVSINRIGYVPIIAGDPSSARVDFPAIGGFWYRLSMLGGVVSMLVAAQAAARRATVGQYLIGLAALVLVGLYGPRYFVVFPLGVGALLWDRARAQIKFGRGVALVLVVAPLLALVGYWREQNQAVALLGPVGLALYGTMVEFRDLGWALDYFGLGDRFLHGRTLASAVVPLLPSTAWQVLGIDKATIYAQSSASALADAMGRASGQRIGLYGEGFINFGWSGAVIGAVLYGVLLAYLDNRYDRVGKAQVRSLFLAIGIATAVFAQIGQLDMFASTLTGYGYPIALAALISARRNTASNETRIA